MWNPFLELGVDVSATAEDVGRTFRAASRQSHPDRGGTSAKMHLLTAARDALVDDASKMFYLAQTRPHPQGSMVQLQGLVTAAGLNGEVGMAGHWTGLRLEVHLPAVGVKAVRPENTTPATLHVAAAAGVVVAPSPEGLVPCSGRDRVECP